MNLLLKNIYGRKGVLKHLFFIYFLLLMVHSCTKEIPYPFDTKEKQTVITALNNSVGNINVKVEESVNVLSTVGKSITDAQVLLYTNNRLIDTLKAIKNAATNQFYYQSSTIPQYITDYSIKIILINGKILSANDRVPNKILINQLKINDKIFSVVDENNQIRNYSTLSFQITDNEDDINYYEISVQQFYKQDNELIACYFPAKYISDSNLLNDSYLFLTDRSIVFSDQNINGDTAHFELIFSPTSTHTSLNQSYVYIVDVKKISENYYLFLKDIVNQNTEKEPFNIFSNIQEGKGIFAFYVSQQDTLIP